MMLLNLNDDCLEYICKFLDLKHQMIMKNVCSRLELIIKTLWKYECKQVVIAKNTFKEISNKDAEFFDFMSSINETVEDLQLGTINSEQFHLLKVLKFPKVKVLNCNIWSDADEPNDDDTLLISQLFPYLTKLTLLSTISGKHMASLSNLTDLDLSCCEFLDTQYFESIFGTLKLRKLSLLYYGYNTNFEEAITAITLCKTLEEIKIDDHHLLLIIDKLLQLPKMHKITCYTVDYDNYLLGKIVKAHGAKMQTLIYNGLIWSNRKLVEHLIKMTNLEKLILYDDMMKSEYFEMIIDNLKNLREIYFMNGRTESDNDLLGVIQNYHQLEIFDISGTKISSSFLERCISIIEKQKNRRKVPLRLYCSDTVIADMISLNTLQPPELLCVSTEKHDVDVTYTRCFLCDWYLPGAETE